MKIPLIIHKDKFEISDFGKAKLRQAVTDNGRPIRGYLETLMPESRSQRRYLMGCLIPLLTCLDNNDYRDTKVLEYYFEHYKKELAPELLKINGKIQIFGKSTKGSKALNNFIEKIQDFLSEQHGLEYDNKAINIEEYKKFRDEIFPFQSKYDCWLDYVIDMKWIKNLNK